MKKIILYALLILGFSSCKKEHTLHIKAINPVTGMGYSGLSYSIKGTRTGSDGEKIVFTYNGTLNTNGEDFPTIKIKENLTYHIGCKEPANICYTKDINFFWDVKANPSPTFQFEYAECAYMKRNIANVNCSGESDYMILYTSNSVNSLGATGWVFNGCASYSGSDFSKIPMGYYYHEWHVTRSGVTNIYYDTIFLQENEYKTYDINY